MHGLKLDILRQPKDWIYKWLLQLIVELARQALMLKALQASIALPPGLLVCGNRMVTAGVGMST